MNKRNLCRTATLLCGLSALTSYARPVSVNGPWLTNNRMSMSLGVLSAIFAALWLQYQKRQDATSTRPGTPSWLRRLLYGSVLLLSVLNASAQTTWTKRPQTGNKQLSDVAYGAGTYVAVGGDDGLIRLSTDGITWINQVAGTTSADGLATIVYAAGKFVTAGSNGRILTSTDGLTWITRISGTTAPLNGITYGGGQFVAVGLNSTIVTSPDGITWTSQVAGPPGPALFFNDVTYGNGQFVLVGGAGTIKTSPDGVAWTTRTSGTPTELYGVTTGGGKFVAVGVNSTVVTSSDGVTWTPQVVAGSATFLTSVAYNTSTGQFVAVANTGNRLLTSANGLTWTASFSGTYQALKGVRYINDQFIAVGEGGTIRSGIDATDWRPLTIVSGLSFEGVAYGNGHYVAVGSYLRDPDISSSQVNLAATSADGLQYALGEPKQLIAGTNHFRNVAFGNGLFAAVGESANVQTSADGKVWASRFSHAGKTLYDIAYGGGRFVAVGNVGFFVRSTDGITWAENSNGSDTYRAITYGNGQFVAVGESGAIGTSPDGATWMPRTSATPEVLTSVTYGNGTYVAIGVGGTAIKSVDGITWTAVPAFTNFGFTDITFGNGQFVAITSFGTIYTAPDGITWTPRTSNVTSGLRGVTHGNGLFVAVGVDATFTTSPDDSVLPPVNQPPVAPAIPDESGTVGQYFQQDIQSFTDPDGSSSTISYSATGVPAGLVFINSKDLDIEGIGLSGKITGTPATAGVFPVIITATDEGGASTQATYTITINPAGGVPPANPGSLTITSFNCFSTNGALTSVDFIVGYANGTFTPAVPDLFINGITITGQLGTTYSLAFDANQNKLTVQDQANRTTYFVWNFRDACSAPVIPPVPPVIDPPIPPVNPPPVNPPPVNPGSLTITSFQCHYTDAVLASVDFVVGYGNGTFTPAVPNLFINGITINGQLGVQYGLSFDANQNYITIQDQDTRQLYFVWDFRNACTAKQARIGVSEPTKSWTLQVLGNPVVEALTVRIDGAEHQAIQLELIDIGGHVVASRRVEPTGVEHQEVFDVQQQGPGLLLLQAIGKAQRQTIKVLKR